jgi:hypothetical protein
VPSKLSSFIADTRSTCSEMSYKVFRNLIEKMCFVN